MRNRKELMNGRYEGVKCFLSGYYRKRIGWVGEWVIEIVILDMMLFLIKFCIINRMYIRVNGINYGRNDLF